MPASRSSQIKLATRRSWKRLFPLALIFALQATPAYAAIENRSGTVVLRITINNKSHYSGQVQCGGNIGPETQKTPTQYLSSWASKNVVKSISATSEAVVCVVSIPFNWIYVDVRAKIRGSVNVYSYRCGSCSLERISVNYGVGDFSFPPNGGTKFVKVSVDI